MSQTEAQEAGRRHRYMSKYGLRVDQVELLADKQGRRCAICRRTEDQSPRGLHVDHDHNSGQVRGLLCMACNTGLGKFADDPARFRAAIAYLASPPATAVLTSESAQ